MTAYMLIQGLRVDEPRVGPYRQAVSHLSQSMGARYVARGHAENFDVLEGELPIVSTVLSRWERLEQITGFWYSDDYAEVKKLRAGIAEYLVYAFPGLADGPLQGAIMVIQASATDLPGVGAHGEAVGPLIEAAGGRTLAQANANSWVLLESEMPFQSVVLSSWPDQAAARAFRDSPAYQALKPLRAAKGDFLAYTIPARF